MAVIGQASLVAGRKPDMRVDVSRKVAADGSSILPTSIHTVRVDISTGYGVVSEKERKNENGKGPLRVVREADS